MQGARSSPSNAVSEQTGEPATVPPMVAQAMSGLLASPLLAGRNIVGVWLFGSHARGTAGAQSDIDIAVLVEPPLRSLRTTLADEVARFAACDVDVIDLSEAPPTLAWEVVTTGRLVHEGDGDAVHKFLRHARFHAEDAARRNRLVLAAQSPAVRARTR